MDRVKRLIAATQLAQREAVVVYKTANQFYLTGFTGEGLAVVGGNGGAVVTDFRYVEQAQRQCAGFEVLSVAKGQTHEEIVAMLCARWNLNTLYYEEDGMTVRAFREACQTVKGVEWKPLHDEIEHLRQVKDEGEIALIEKACKITGESFERILPQIAEGMTEKELAVKLEYDMLAHGADSLAFSTIVAAGANGSLPHAVPGDYRIRRGDMITMDFGAKVGGYCADMTRTVALGAPSDEMKRVYQTVQTAQQRSKDAVMAGADCRAIDAIARDYIDAQGYRGCFGHGLGHSLGIEIHESPRLNAVALSTLSANQLMTVEPGVYLPGVGGVRIEDTVVVAQGGCRTLTLPTKELLIL
ncbi:MAG TPA: aminopeptidase P family protein [Candidatus Limiplasma sp.]|nr:aminopeptidase P family protein [Candidatus Limiplasma sp.]HPS81128.1 aminopeptidase P family protein [Candidatus Limiplasma sp.]